MSCKPMSQEEYISKAKEIHGDKYDYSKVKYKLRSDKIIITCPQHGDFEQSAHNHLNKNGCRVCWQESKRSKIEDFLIQANLIHNNKYNYKKTKYINANTKIVITCKEHGDFTATPNNHLSRKSGCPRCKKSKGELAIGKILDKYRIEYIDEYKLPNYNFEYDFYLPDFNVFIEFHGKQHYEPIEYFGGEKIFKYIQQCDMFKRSLARDYKIPLIEINYSQFENLSENDFELFVVKILSNYKKGKNLA